MVYSAPVGEASVNQASTAYRWNIIFLLACSQVVAYVSRVNLSVAGSELIKVHHYSPALLGVLFSVFNWFVTLSVLLAGPFVDWVRPRIAYPLCVGVWSLATVLCGLTTSFAPLAVFRAFVGIGEAAMIPSGSSVIRETFEKEKRTMVVGAFFSGNRIGLALGISLASLILVKWGWDWVFYITGSLGFVWIAWWLAVYGAQRRSVAKDTQPREAERIRWATLLRYRTTWGIMLGQAGYLYIFYVFANWLPGYLVLQRGMSVITTGFVGMLPFLVGTVSVILGGWAGDRFIAAGWRVTLVRKGFAVGGLFAATVFTIA